MKKTDFMTMTAAMMLATSACVGPEKAAQADGPIIGKQEVTVKDGRMTPETLWAMGRIGRTCMDQERQQTCFPGTGCRWQQPDLGNESRRQRTRTAFFICRRN